jgi:uncharacterized protein
MAYDCYWSPEDGAGLEHVHLVEGLDCILADGIVLRRLRETSIRLHYKIQCEIDWKVRSVEVAMLDGKSALISLESDGNGRWRERNGTTLPILDRCIDVDIAATPFTNTLPIRRLTLATGESREIEVVYVSVPALDISTVRQRYTCLNRGATRSLYRYEGLNTGFTAELAVDGQGVVLDYPGGWRRVWPAP